MTTALVVLGGYLAGSIPFGLLLVRWLRGVDIRSVGSGNIGATNVWRSFGPQLGLPVAFLDLAKGLAPALAGVLLLDDGAGVLAGSAAMLGHWRPLFMGFSRGGKMVATAGGVFLAVAPLLGLVAAVLWIAVAVLTRYASVATIAAALALPPAAALLGEPWPVIVFATGASIGVLLLHRANVGRLRAGTENRLELRRARKRAAASSP
ncbi:MAG: glycerol-3-phosphate 1-O-acyltransferase PlsY [Actinobacteria bacterium]|nr:glycerol-3-phosphate 1-O-acyltransferase PlsY [Actinomycetota bacterium]